MEPIFIDDFGSHYTKKGKNITYFTTAEEQEHRDVKIIKLATTKAQESKDFGIKTDTLESAKAYLDIFHNIKF